MEYNDSFETVNGCSVTINGSEVPDMEMKAQTEIQLAQSKYPPLLRKVSHSCSSRTLWQGRRPLHSQSSRFQSRVLIKTKTQLRLVSLLWTFDPKIIPLLSHKAPLLKHKRIHDISTSIFPAQRSTMGSFGPESLATNPVIHLTIFCSSRKTNIFDSLQHPTDTQPHTATF